MNLKTRLLAMAIAAFWSAPLFAASDHTGLVNAINVNKSWGGIFVQLAGGPIFEPGTECASKWAFIPINDDYAKAVLAIAAAAKVAGEPLRVGTSGCLATPVGWVAKIEWIDFGIRIN